MDRTESLALEIFTLCQHYGLTKKPYHLFKKKTFSLKHILNKHYL
jgi:hypothetical protein